MREIIWAPNAIQQLNDIVDYISIDSEKRAEEWAYSIIDSIERLAEFPDSGRNVKGVENPEIREIIKGSYRIVYQIKESVVEILVVKNTHQASIGL